MPESAQKSMSKPSEYYIEANGLRFCVEERGYPEGPPIVLIMGLACQMTSWPESLLDRLAEQGYRIVRFDNRDIGLSDKLQSSIRVDTRLAFLFHKLGFKVQANYSLHDMAKDTSCIMTELGISNAHIVGISMGGMIAQLLAAHYPEQVKTLTAIMSSTNSARLPMPEFKLLLKLSQAGVKGHDEQSVVKRWMKFWKAIGSPDYPTSNEEIKALMEASYRRNYSAGGTLRQLQAILATGNLSRTIRKIKVPTLVIHGSRDPLLKPACGKAIQKQIPEARFKLVHGLGHDLPEVLIPKFVDLINYHAKESPS